MVDPQKVQTQLVHVGLHSSFVAQAELDELPNILMENENIEHVVVGRYSGGFALLVATNLRLLLVDKKLMFLNVEDVRYDMIAELDYGHQLIGATLHVRSFSKDLKFQAFNKLRLRTFTHFVQHKVMQMRQQLSEDTSKIPLQTFEEHSGTAITAEQAKQLLPITRESWQRANSGTLPANPYVQSPLLTRRRIGPYPITRK